MSQPVGYLVPSSENGFALVCFECDRKCQAKHNGMSISDAKVPICHDNIYPYRGTCASCKVVLVQPQTEAWPELFDASLSQG